MHLWCPPHTRTHAPSDPPSLPRARRTAHVQCATTRMHQRDDALLHCIAAQCQVSICALILMQYVLTVVGMALQSYNLQGCTLEVLTRTPTATALLFLLSSPLSRSPLTLYEGKETASRITKMALRPRPSVRPSPKKRAPPYVRGTRARDRRPIFTRRLESSDGRYAYGKRRK